MNNNELTHYGVKGMKWGVVRRSDDTRGGLYAKPSHNGMLKDGPIKPRVTVESQMNTAGKIGGAIGSGLRKGAQKIKSTASKVANSEAVRKTTGAAKAKAKDLKNSELANRGKAAIDVIMNGDTDWMGKHSYSDSATTELKNRGKAALERLMYSEEQIHNKKFFGRYDF